MGQREDFLKRRKESKERREAQSASSSFNQDSYNDFQARREALRLQRANDYVGDSRPSYADLDLRTSEDKIRDYKGMQEVYRRTAGRSKDNSDNITNPKKAENNYRYNSIAEYDEALKAAEEDINKGSYTWKNVVNAMINSPLSQAPALAKASAAYGNKYTDAERYYSDLKKEASKYKNEHAYEELRNNYINNADFAAKSGDLTADEIKSLGSREGAQFYEANTRLMNDEEKQIANYIFRTEGAKGLQEYFNKVMPAINERAHNAQMAEQNEWLDEKTADIENNDIYSAALSAVVNKDQFYRNALASLGTVPANLLGGLGSIGEFVDSVGHGREYNPYSGAAGLASWAEDTRQGVSENITEATGSEKVLPFAYQTLMSVGDSALGAVTLGNAYTPLMGGTAFNSTYRDVKEKGGTEQDAMVTAFSAGVFEALFEKVSIDNLLKPKNIGNLKTWAKETIKQAGVEGSEEVFTELANIFSDQVINGINSDVQIRIQELRDQGYSEADISSMVAEELALQVGEAGLGGVLSGLLMGGVGNTIQARNFHDVGKGLDRKAFEESLSEDVKNNLKAEYGENWSEKVSNTQMGAIYADVMAQTFEGGSKEAQKAATDAIAKTYNISKEEAAKYSKALFDSEATDKEKKILESHFGSAIIDDIRKGKGFFEAVNQAERKTYNIARNIHGSFTTATAKAQQRGFNISEKTSVNGTEAKITGLKKDGKNLIVVTDQGEVNANDKSIKFSNQDAQLIAVASEFKDANMANAFVANYKGQNIDTYTNDMKLAFAYGSKEGLGINELKKDLPNFNIDSESIINMYEAGVAARNAIDNEAKKANEEIRKNYSGTFRKGTFTSDVKVENLNSTERQLYLMAQSFSDMGINVKVIHDTDKNSKNGEYDKNTNTVTINLAARYSKNGDPFDRHYAINTMAHELTHWMEVNAAEEFAALKGMIWEYFDRTGIDTEKLIHDEMKSGISRKAAESEVMARACEDMLSNPDTYAQITANADKSFHEKFREAVLKVLDKIKDLLNRMMKGYGSNATAATFVRQNQEAFEKFREQWIKTFDEALKFNQALNEYIEKNVQDVEDIKNSSEYSMKADVEINEDDLMAFHNLDEASLLKTIKLGGFAMPSIAVKRAITGHVDYGPITVVFPKQTIENDDMFSGDAWTPTFPEVDNKISEKVREKIYKKVMDLVGGFEMYHRTLNGANLDTDNLTDIIGRKGNAVEGYKNNRTLQYAFLQDTGKGFDVPMKEKQQFSNLSNEAIGAIAKVLGEETIEQMREGGYSWMREHPEEVNRLKLMLNEAAIKEYEANVANGTKPENEFLRKHYATMFGSENEQLAFADFDKVTVAMWRLLNGTEQVVDTKEYERMLDERVDDEAYTKWLTDLFDGIIEKQGIRNNKDFFLPSGARRSWDALHYELTLENVVKVMKEQAAQGVAGFFSGSNIWGIATKKYKNLYELKADMGRLIHQNEAERDAQRSEFTERLVKIASEIMDKREHNPLIAHDRAAEAIVDSLRGRKTVNAINKVLAEYVTLNVHEDTAQEILDLYNDILNMPTDYFEAKPRRAVGLDEIAYVVIPSTASDNLKNTLNEYAIPFYEYESENLNDRIKVTNNAALEVDEDVLFSQKIGGTYANLTSAGDDFSGSLLEQDYARIDQMIKAGKGVKLLSGEHGYILDNMLVYTKRNKITRVVTVNNNLDKKNEVTYSTFVLEDLIENEKNRRLSGNSFSEIARIEQSAFSFDFGGKVDIRADYGNAAYTDAVIGLGRQSEARRPINYHFGDEQNGERNIGKSRLNSVKLDSEGNDLAEGQQTFFAKSQIRDDDGNLLVMYHGTDAYEDFTVFQPGKYGYLGKGMYFSASENYAKRYADQNGYNGRIYKVYLNVTNPLVVTSDNPAAEILGEKVAAKRAAKNSYSTRWLTSADIKKLQDKGYDGIIWKYGKSPVEVSVWDPSQIKLTTNENPTDNPDIRYSIKADADRIFYTSSGVEVVQNPTSTEYNQMREDILKEYPWLRGTGEPLFRHTYDEEGNEYYWEAGSGLHSQIEPEINKHYNTRTSQQYRWWEQPDKDDYPRNYSYSESEAKRYSLKEVDPVNPSSELWQRSYTTDEARNVFANLWNVDADESEMRNPTQVQDTIKSYRKVYQYLKERGFKGNILDASSGLGLGTQAGRDEFGFNVDDIEPFPSADYNPKYKDYSKLHKKYDFIINNAVLNVLPQDQRDALVVKIGELLKEGGQALISVRTKSDVNGLKKNPKNIRLNDSEYIVQSTGSYQKGFTDSELKAYIQDALGSDFIVETSKLLNGTTVMVTKKAAAEKLNSSKLESDGYVEVEKGKLGFTDDRIDYFLKEYANSSKNYAQAWITYMSPDDFLKLTTGKNQRILDRIKDWKTGEHYKGEDFNFEKFAETYDRYSKIYLELDHDNNEVVEHNGRHRMVQLAEMGYTKIPVLIFNMSEYSKYHKDEVKGINILPQYLGEKDETLGYNDRVFITDLVPFSGGNADLIKERFGSGSKAETLFSNKVDDEYNELASRYYNIYEEEKKTFSGDVKRLTEAIVKRKVNLEDLNDHKLGLAADALLKEANSTYDRDELIGDLFETYRYIIEGATYDGNVDWDAMMGRAYDTADKILSKAKAKSNKDGFYSEIIKSLKNTRVHLNDAQIAELKSQYDKDWNKVLFGKIRMVKDPAAISLDSLWHDLSHDYPDIFKQDVSDTDEPLMLIEAINDLNTLAEQNARAEDQMDTVRLAESVYEKFWNIAILDTSIEKAMEARNRNALREQKIKAEHDLSAQKEFYEQKGRIEASKAQAEQYEAVKRAQEQGKQAVADQRLADDIFFTAKERKAIRDRVEKDKQRVKQLVAEHKQAMKELTAAKNIERRAAVDQNRVEQKIADSIYYGKIFAKYKEKKAEDMRKYKEYVAKKAEARKEEAQRRVVISDITDMAKTLADWMRENGKKHRVPEPLKRPVGELLNAIDYSSKRLLGLTQGENAYMPTKKDISMGRALEQVRDIVARASKGQTSEGIDDAFNGYIDFPPQYADELTEISERVNEIERKTKDGAYVLQMMSLDDLLDLKEAVKVMKHAVSKMNSLISQTNAHSVDYYAQDTINFADENAKELKERNKAGQIAESTAKKASGFINFTNGLPYYVFKHMGDGSKYMFSLLQNGWDKFAFNIKAISDFTEDLYTDKEVNEWTKEVHDVTVLEVATDAEKAEGKENTERNIKLTTAQIMSLYCLAKRDQAKGHILGGGIRIADFKEEWRTISQSRAVTLTESELARITDMLTDRQKEVADELQKFMNTTCSEWGNEVTMKRFGIKAFTEENYFPIKSDSNVLRADVRDDVKSIYALLNMSFTKALVKNANNQIVVDDIFNVFTVHASDMAKYNSLALPVLDMIKWWNYSEKDERGGQSFTTRSVKIALENAYGKDANKYIRNLLSDINGAAESGRYDKGFSKMTKRYKTAAVGANLSVALLQPISYARAIYSIDKKYLVKGLAKKPSIEKCKQYAGIALWKSLGFYDTNINMGLDKIIKHANSTGDKLVDLSLKLAETGDSLTWGYLWNAVEAEISDTRNLAYGSEAFNEAVAERLREILYSTQVFDSTLSRSDIMRAKGWAQLVTAFMSEPTVTVNMMNDARIDFQREASKNGLNSAMRKHGKQVANACEAYVLTATLEAVVRSVLDKLRDNDDDETFLETFLAELKDALNPLGKIPFLKDIVSIFQGYSPTRMDTSYAKSIYEAYMAITKVPENGWTYKTTYKLMQAIGQTTGLPLSNAMRELATLWNNTIGRMYPDLQLNK